MPRTITWTVLPVAAALLMLPAAAVMLVPRLLYPPLSSNELRGVVEADKRVELRQKQSELQNAARATLLQGFGGMLLVAGAVGTWRQLQVSREGQITDRFTRAVDQLGSDKLDIRIGGIYALERIARNSPPDRATISEILTAFVRSHAPWLAGLPETPDPHPSATLEDLPPLNVRAADVQAAMTVLGRRPAAGGEEQLALFGVDLRRAYLSRTRLDGAMLQHANLSRAWLRFTRLEGSRLENADLRQADLHGADLASANLRRAHLQQARLRSARLEHADLRSANLRGADLRMASLRGADLRGAELDGAELEEADLTGIRTDTATSLPDDPE